jgi:DNA-binding NtrC family response regulator
MTRSPRELVVANQEIRVLLVDDEQDLIEYLSKRLLREGFMVRAVTSGEEAIEAVAAEDFDVAVVDLKMPGMDGLTTQQRIKERRPYLQTIVLTGHGSLTAAMDSGRQNAFRFLEKPANHDELVDAILGAADRKKKERLAAFWAEMTEITTSGGSPRDIVAGVEALRRKYQIE